MTTREALKTLLRCHIIIARNMARLFDRGAHRFPYVYMLGVFAVLCATYLYWVGKARIERDAATCRAYQYEQRCDSLALVIEAYEGGRHHGN